MSEILKTTLIGLFFGTFGTTIGGIIGVKFKDPSKKFLSFILAFASGLMLAIVCFDLLPEAFNLTNLPTAFLGIFLGIAMMIICDLLVDKKFNRSTRFKDNKNALLKTVVKRVEYLKTEKAIKKNSDPTDFELDIYPNIG